MTARLPPFFALRALEAAARRESYSRAAEELSVTHSAVSQHIRALEAEFGLRLFQRRGNRMEPTPPALRLAAEVARAVNILQGGVNAFAGAPARQPLILSIGGYFARRWLPPRLPRLLAHPAGAQLDIRVENRHVDLLTEDIDVGVRYGSGRWEGLEAQRLFGEALFPVCSPALALDYDLRQTEDLLRTPLLHRPGRPWSLWFDRFGLSAPVPSGPMFDDPVMLLEAAAQGLGVALGDESLAGGLVDQDLELGRLVRPFGDSAVSDLYVYMVWRRDSRKLPRIHALRDWMVDEIEGRHALDGPPA